MSGPGVDLIGAERRRQIEVEGYTASRDVGGEDELALAASIYATPARLRAYISPAYEVPVLWPWGHLFWKPTPDDRVRELVKAGALIAAAIDALTKEA